MDLNIPYIICAVLSFVPAIVLHEVAHGFAAYKLGDPTAKAKGRLTLNPLKHVDPFGTVILPGLLMIMGGPVFGYAKPVPYNPGYFKDPRKGDVIVGLAGPSANLLMAVVGAIVSWLLYPLAMSVSPDGFFGLFFYYFYYLFLPLFGMINLYLMFFNLLPIPPLDGSSIFAVLIPEKYLRSYYKVQQYALPIFFVVVFGIPYLFSMMGISFNPVSWYLNITANNLASLLYPTL